MAEVECPECEACFEATDKELGDFDLGEIVEHLEGDNSVQCVDCFKFDGYIVANTSRNEVITDYVGKGGIKILIIQM